MDLGLHGTSVLVTGGFAAEGCRVHIAARNRERLENAKSELGAQVNILVNNAGGSLQSVDEARWREAWELKLFGYINLSRELYARMQARATGVIVNVIGMAAEKPTFDYICASTANAGLAGFTKALGKGLDKHGVRVLGVHPPATRTERISKARSPD